MSGIIDAARNGNLAKVKEIVARDKGAVNEKDSVCIY